MKKTLWAIILALMVNPCWASTVNVPYTFAPTDSVTNVKLNNNNNAITAVVNGGLDNTNADTTNGYRFFETKAALPAAGSQGRTVFLTTDNTLNFDNGTSWNAVFTLSGTPAKGDTIYYDGSAWQRLGIGSTGQALTVSSGLPSWNSGLGISSLSTDDIIYYNGSAFVPLHAGTAGQFLQTNGAGSNPQWASIGSYDSGCFAVGQNGTYTKTHSLGTTKLNISVYASTSADCSNSWLESPNIGGSGEGKGPFVTSITTTQFTVRIGSYWAIWNWDGSGNQNGYTSGYLRIIASVAN